MENCNSKLWVIFDLFEDKNKEYHKIFDGVKVPFFYYLNFNYYKILLQNKSINREEFQKQLSSNDNRSLFYSKLEAASEKVAANYSKNIEDWISNNKKIFSNDIVISPLVAEGKEYTITKTLLKTGSRSKDTLKRLLSAWIIFKSTQQEFYLDVILPLEYESYK